MKIIIINGSYRKDGATAKILNQIKENLSIHTDVDIDMINIAELELNFCRGCCSCYITGECIFKDDIENLSNKIKEADGIVLGSPTYASNVSAQMKLLIDRGHFVMEQLLNNKYSISVATYENFGGHDTSRILNKLLFLSGSYINGKIIYKVPFNINPLTDPKLLKQLSRKSELLYNNILHKNTFILQTMLHKLIFNFGIKPFVIKKGTDYKGVIKHWNQH